MEAFAIKLVRMVIKASVLYVGKRKLIDQAMAEG
jgi:hypothetical protein